VAGFVDSIAGGGGLVTLPSMAWIVGPGVLAIGTNKIVGTAAALVALFVYLSRGHFDGSRSFWFALWVGLGSFVGSRIAPLIPAAAFNYFLIATCPLILWVVWRKDLWVSTEAGHGEPSTGHGKRVFEKRVLALLGLGCGFYDGVWGPGGGTFMFLSLFFFGKLPLLAAIAASKLSNAVSAGTALVSYAFQGQVRVLEGSIMASGVVAGSYVGARHATTRASRIVRPVLVAVVALLVLKLLSGLR
jgi:uncharacterized membrane protein YfcA